MTEVPALSDAAPTAKTRRGSPAHDATEVRNIVTVLTPFTVARGDNGICGLNIVGLRRAGFAPEQRRELKRLYLILFRGGRKLREAVEEAREDFQGDAARVMLDFVGATRRGICADTGFIADSDEE